MAQDNTGKATEAATLAQMTAAHKGCTTHAEELRKSLSSFTALVNVTTFPDGSKIDIARMSIQELVRFAEFIAQVRQ